MKALKTICIFTFCFLSAAYSQIEWELIPSPYSGDITFIEFNSNNELYAGAGSVYHTIPGSEEWAYLGGLWAQSMGITPDDHLFIGTFGGNGMYRSTDNGKTWTHLTGGLPVSGDINVVLPIDSDTVIINNIVHGLYISRNAGETWESIDTPFLQWASNVFLAYPDGLILAGVGIYFYRSEDFGTSWDITDTLEYNNYSSLDLLHNGYIAAGTEWNGNIKISDNRGMTWQDIPPLPVNRRVLSVTLDYDSVFYAATYDSVYFYSPGENGWQSYTNISSNFRAFRTVTVDRNGNVFAGNIYGLFRLDKETDSWKIAGVPSMRVFDTLATGNTIQLAATTKGLYVYHDTDQSWETKLSGSWHALLSLSPDTVFAAGDFAFRVTHDGGHNWTSGGIDSRVFSIASDEEYVYAGLFTGGLMISDDRGATWQNTNFDKSYVRAVLPAGPGALFAGSLFGGGVHKSEDRGNTWHVFGLTGRSIFSLLSYKTDTVIALADDRIYLSPMDAPNWQRSRVDGELAVLSIFTHDTLIVAGTMNGIYISSDDGSSWTHTGLEDVNVPSITIGGDGHLYAGTDYAGIYRSRQKITGIKEYNVPVQFMLAQNYPNPFNPGTTIRFELPEQSPVTLEIYNILGQHIRTLIDGEVFHRGTYDVSWDGKDSYNNTVASGVYVYRLTTDTHTAVRKMQLIR